MSKVSKFARGLTCTVTWLLMTCGLASSELLKNGDFEAGLTNWNTCWNFKCELATPTGDSRFGSNALRVSGRTDYWMGPGQIITTSPGKSYKAQSWVRILNDKTGRLGQKIELEVSFAFPDGTKDYINVAMMPLVTAADGWFLLQGDFQTPPKAVTETNFYYQGPDPGVDFMVDLASVTEVQPDPEWRNKTDEVINRIRKSDINVRVITADGIDKSQVKIQLLQTRKSFPFGTALDWRPYLDPTKQKFRHMLHTHFNWAVPGLGLKWRQLEPVQGQTNYDRVINTIKGLKQNGMKVRGHNIFWSVEEFIPTWVKALSGDVLRKTVSDHVKEICNRTRGLLESWDVNNEELHGQWFQERLQDRDYDLELFRMVAQADPQPKLFLNDYNVVAQGAATGAYLAQAERYKAAPGVNLYGLGVQSHFHKDQEPNPTLMKERLDTLAQTGLPLWASELDVQVVDENKRADYYEKALRALYGHPAIEGIIFWGFWDQAHYAGEPASLVKGDNLDMTAAGRRVFDLFENEWMTDETRVLAESGNDFTVRGFHGDYELRVRYRGQEVASLKQTFTLGKAAKTIDVNVTV